MNREIKFRSWNPKLKRMTYSEGLHSAGFQFSGNSFKVLNMVQGENVDETLMQFTGLKDKNGKEIYEGDIIRDSKGIGVVYYYPPQFVVQTEEEVAYQLAAGYVNKERLDESEIIGNIYEHSHLLK